MAVASSQATLIHMIGRCGGWRTAAVAQSFRSRTPSLQNIRRLRSAITIRTDGAQICDVFGILNPDKLRGIQLPAALL
jgi:hypothetical protein